MISKPPSISSGEGHAIGRVCTPPLLQPAGQRIVLLSFEKGQRGSVNFKVSCSRCSARPSFHTDAVVSLLLLRCAAPCSGLLVVSQEKEKCLCTWFIFHNLSRAHLS